MSFSIKCTHRRKIDSVGPFFNNFDFRTFSVFSGLTYIIYNSYGTCLFQYLNTIVIKDKQYTVHGFTRISRRDGLKFIDECERHFNVSIFRKSFPLLCQNWGRFVKHFFFCRRSAFADWDWAQNRGFWATLSSFLRAHLSSKQGVEMFFLRSKSCRELGAQDRRAQNNDEEVMYRGKAQVSKLHLLSIMGRAIWSHLWHHIVYHNIELMFNDLIYKIGLRH